MVNLDTMLINLIKDNQNADLAAILKDENLPNIKDSRGATLLHYAAMFNNRGMTKLCVDSKCDVNAKDVDGLTPLFVAAKNASFDAMSILLNADSDIFYVTPDGQSTLGKMFDCKREIPPLILRNLLKKIRNTCASEKEVADVLMKEKFPFYYVTHLNNSKLMRIMLEDGCQVNERNPFTGKTALQEAFTLNDAENVTVLLNYNAHVDINSKVLIKTLFARVNDFSVRGLKVVFLIIERLTQSKSLNEYGYFLLGQVFKMATREVLEAFLQYNINLNGKDVDDKTLLHYVVFNRKQNTIDLFRNKMIDVNAKDNSGRTALQYAVAHEACVLNNVQFLLEKGADIGQTDEAVCLLLESVLPQLIVLHAHKQCMELLLQFGADPQVMKNDGRSVIDFALSRERHYRAQVILEPVVAHIALLLAHDKPVNEAILEKINGHGQLEKYLATCKKNIDEMRNYEISKGLNVFQVLSETDKNLRKLVRQDKNVLNFMNRKDMPKVNSYYTSTLNGRINRAVEMNKLIEVAIENVMESIVLFKGQLLIVNEIVGYLSYADLLMFS